MVPVPGDLLRVRQPANTPQHNANAGTLATMQGMQCLSYSVSASCQNSSLRQLHSALTSRPSCHKHEGWRVRVCWVRHACRAPRCVRPASTMWSARCGRTLAQARLSFPWLRPSRRPCNKAQQPKPHSAASANKRCLQNDIFVRHCRWQWPQVCRVKCQGHAVVARHPLQQRQPCLVQGFWLTCNGMKSEMQARMQHE